MFLQIKIKMERIFANIQSLFVNRLPARRLDKAIWAVLSGFVTSVHYFHKASTVIFETIGPEKLHTLRQLLRLLNFDPPNNS